MIDTKLDDILERWHTWRTGYKPTRGFNGKSAGIDYRPSRQYDDCNGALDAAIEDAVMRDVDFQIEQMLDLMRWAVQEQARDLCIGYAVIRNPRLPENRDDRAALLGEARAALRKRLESAGGDVKLLHTAPAAVVCIVAFGRAKTVTLLVQSAAGGRGASKNQPARFRPRWADCISASHGATNPRESHKTMPAFKKGQKPGPGRPKGVPNGTTQTAKEAIAMAAEGLGGAIRLIAWAKEDPANERAFWASIYPKLIPVQLAGSDDGSGIASLQITFK